MDKLEIRRMMKERLLKMTDSDYHDWSNKIAANLYSYNDWRQAKTIGITISRGSEVDTHAIIEMGWKEGKRIVVPKCDPATKEMTFRILHSFDQLEIVYYGLEEPKETETEAVLASEIDLTIVPGLAYNQRGYRIGFGGGYYDRFLSKFAGRTAALAFDIQLVEGLPLEKHDAPVHTIITNERVFYVNHHE